MQRYHLHMPGVIYCVLTLMVALAAMNSQNNLLFWLFGMLCAALILSAVISTTMVMRLRVKRVDPQYGAVGEPLLIRYSLSNGSRILPAFNIHVEERIDDSRLSDTRPPVIARAWIMHIGPRETVHGEAMIWPTSRAPIHFDRLRVWTTFPFGILRKSTTISQSQYTLVYPQLYELRPGILRSVSPPGMMGNRTVVRPGPPEAGDEYFGLREYRANESIRSIAWKRSAQLDQLVCIERSIPSPPRLRIVLNLTVPTEAIRVHRAEGGDSKAPVRKVVEEQGLTARLLEERAISLAASIAHLAHLQGMEISMTALGIRQPRMAMRRSYWHLHKVMAALASIDLDGPRDASERLPSIDADRAGVICIHPDRVDVTAIAAGRGEALHLTGRQMRTLTAGPIGWDAAALARQTVAAQDSRREREAAPEAAA